MRNDAHISTIHGNNSIARAFMQYGGVDSYAAANPLPEGSVAVIDRVINIAGHNRSPLRGLLIDRGLSFQIEDWLSTPLLYRLGYGLNGEATESMEPPSNISDGENGGWDNTAVPVYMTWMRVPMGTRHAAVVSRMSGMQVDEIALRSAAELINFRNEKTIIEGSSIALSGNMAKGLNNAPNVNNHTLTATWNTATTEQIYTDARDMIVVLEQNNKYGPIRFVMGTSYGARMNDSYNASSPAFTIADKIKSINTVDGTDIDIIISPAMPGDMVTAVVLEPSTIHLGIGATTSVVNMTPMLGGGGPNLLATDLLIFNVVVPMIQSDAFNQCGVVKGTP